MRISRKAAGAAAVSVGLAVTLAACGSSGNSGKGTGSSTGPKNNSSSDSFFNKGPTGGGKGGTLKLLGESENPSMDWSGAYDTASYSSLRAYTRQLYTNPSANTTAARLPVVPDMADGMPQISSDGLTYTVKIKQGVKWDINGQGRQVTAEDVVRGVKMVCNPVTPTGPVGYLTDTVVGMQDFCTGFGKVSQTSAPAIKAYEEGKNIPGVEIVDPSTVKFTLKKPASDFIHFLTLPYASARPVEMLAYIPDSPQGRQHLISDGPYTISKYVPMKSLTMVRNPVWDASTDTVRKANVDQIDTVYGGTSESIQQQISAGTADMAVSNEPVPTAQLSGLIRQQDIQLHLNPTGGPKYLVFNLIGGSKAVQNQKVRQAVNYAVDKRAIVQVLGGAKVETVRNQIFGPSVVGDGYKELDPYSSPNNQGDPAKAKQLLKDAGFPNGITLKYEYRTTGVHPKIATTLQESLSKAGIKLIPSGLDSSNYYTNYLQKPSIAKAGKWDMAEPSWGPDWEGSSERSFFSPLLDGRAFKAGSASTNYGGYNDDAVNTLADQALADTSTSDAVTKWTQVDQMIMADAPWVPLVEDTQGNYVSKRLKDFEYYYSALNGDIVNVSVQ